MKLKIVIPLLCFLLIFPYSKVFAFEYNATIPEAYSLVKNYMSSSEDEADEVREAYNKMLALPNTIVYWDFRIEGSYTRVFLESITFDPNIIGMQYINKSTNRETFFKLFDKSNSGNTMSLTLTSIYFEINSDKKVDPYSIYTTKSGGFKNELSVPATFPIVVAINGLEFTNPSDLPSDLLPIPPSIDEDGMFGYEFIYPKNKENINLLNTNNNSYLKVPFKVKIKNFYPWGTKTVEEKVKANFSINTYKTEITSFIWEKKTDILGLSDYGLFYIEGNYYIPIGTISDTLTCNVYMPSEPWINGNVNVNYTYDGSLPSYNPNDNADIGGSIDDNGNVNIGGQDYGEIPSAPIDGDIGDWFAYLGSLLLWLVTYPFKLLGQIVSTLASYITNMFNILTPVTAQLNSVLSFIPSDILNVCWGFLSFTVLYSVIKSVFKMIRG